MKIDGTERITYHYDRLGRYAKKTITYPGGQTSDTTYTYVSGKKDGTTTALVNSVLRDGVDVLLKRFKSLPALVNSVLRDGVETFYRYNGVGNITEVLEKTAADSQPVSRFVYEYDLMNQLVKEEDKKEGSIRTYEYDAGGNLLKYKKYTVKDGKQTLVLTDSYAYGNTWKDQMTSYNGSTVTYDDMGNPLTYLGMKLSWEKGRELVQVEKDGNTTRYVYDSDGRRIQKSGKDGTTHYYLNGSAVIAQKTDAGERMDFLYDDKGNVFAVDYKDKLYFYQTNLQGDITGIVDSNGNQVVTYTYDSWGKLLASTDNSGVDLAKKNPFRYRGYYYDVETGFYYLNDRYYDPKVRRFVNADSIDTLSVKKDFHDKNLYGYCDNNPGVRVDVEGEIWVAAIAVGVGTQYVTDVLENIIDGKKGINIFRLRSSVGDYVSAGVTALIPGSKMGAVIIRNVVGEVASQGTDYAIQVVKKKKIVKPKIKWKKTLIEVGEASIYEGVSNKLVNSMARRIDNKFTRNYSTYAGRQYKKHPKATRKQIQKKFYRSQKRQRRTFKIISFVLGIIGAVGGKRKK